NVRLNRGSDPLKISLEACIQLIEAQGKTPVNQVLASFGDIQVLQGRYGPYIKRGRNNYKIPSGKDPSKLTESDCLAIIEKKK
ncbi:MAG: hypothetical protein II763_04525, partial [Bacteroidales bacterium]|nr:hypothetical protein [Bacteroidales bacterium]